MKQWFVTGGTGFIGGELIRQLRAQGDGVRALVRDPSKASALQTLGVELVAGDVREPGPLRAAMAGCDGVYHLAAWYKLGGRSREDAENINVLGTENVIDAAVREGVGKIVYTSSLAVFSDTKGRLPAEDHVYTGEHLSLYDATKWRAHYEVAVPAIQRGAPVVIVQPGAVYGPGDQSPLARVFADWMLGRLPMVPAGSAVCWGHVEDTARAHRLAMEHGRLGEATIIAGPAHTFAEVLALASTLVGVPAPRFEAPPWLLRALAAILELPSRHLDLPDTMHPEALRVSAGVTYLGLAAKASREWDWRGRSIEEGLPSYLADIARRYAPHLARS